MLAAVLPEASEVPLTSRLLIGVGPDVPRSIVDVTATIRFALGDGAVWKAVVELPTDPKAEPLELPCPDGGYAVEAVLPGGARAHAEGVVLGEAQEVRLAPIAALAGTPSRARRLQSTGVKAATLREVMGPVGRVRLWRRDGEGGWTPLVAEVRVETTRELVKLVLPPLGGMHDVLAEVAGTTGPSEFAVAPCEWRVHGVGPAEVSIQVGAGAATPAPGRGKPTLTVRAAVQDSALDQLASLLLQDDVGVLDRLGHLVAETAGRLMASKAENGLLSAAAALVVLRMRRVDILHDWTWDLAAQLPELPDGAAIRAWHLLLDREGATADRRPGESPLQLLLDAASRGLPIFTASLRLLADGLRLFLSRDTAAAAALERLAPFRLGADPDEVFTSFRGSGPDRPDTAAAPPDPPWLTTWGNKR